mmetsp:Transcript_33493/g.77243  ORF Transcript_33493/g.77243 Transcript_33493/m.77243 type:complete len:160 (-) Transcript_33493:476-955(-)|eukprot:CAMPEP_0113325514 /NCGR_PEP_ID=MMETSP0010_2-20120614/17826_1 /TAXON_ID=216773 ORGANISM="Corethron hystrix, Strain 308" /NCGR_SAMPLE_ID=MMETSP0010_2 /ASSEMBLY_ACC=CAM_ASM_000155 /LENGTH=159 /DNA_ID=CAMNT_0000185379 /DNA_START=26 /DNA_END=505 /DNA_ORIENTATION=+ /assembly_acc=CAM_ASM_000155
MNSSHVNLSRPSTGTTVRASSTLNRDSALYGPQHVLTSDDSAWNSAALTTSSSSSAGPSKKHTLLLNFGRLVHIRSLGFMFQGGFVGTDCNAAASNDDESLVETELEFEDCNEMQVFDFCREDGTAVPAKKLKITFKGSTDFYGRVTIYRLEVYGDEIS